MKMNFNVSSLFFLIIFLVIECKQFDKTEDKTKDFHCLINNFYIQKRIMISTLLMRREFKNESKNQFDLG
jgi:ATP sulfurylase